MGEMEADIKMDSEWMHKVTQLIRVMEESGLSPDGSCWEVQGLRVLLV